MSWYKQGFQAVAEEQQRQQASSGSVPNAFWMRPGEIKDIVLVDDEPHFIKEHMVKTNEKPFGMPLTCLYTDEEPENAECCVDMGYKSAYSVGYFTCVDCSEQKDPTYQYELKFFPAKMDTLSKLKLKKDKLKTLCNIKWSMSRSGKKTAKVGDDMDRVSDIDQKSMDKLFAQVTYKGKKIAELFDQANRQGATAIEKLKKIFTLQLDSAGKILPIIPAFNYSEILKPKDPKFVKLLMKTRIKEDMFSSSKGGNQMMKPGTVEDLPF